MNPVCRLSIVEKKVVLTQTKHKHKVQGANKAGTWTRAQMSRAKNQRTPASYFPAAG
jgi:hypothetical protein